MKNCPVRLTVALALCAAVSVAQPAANLAPKPARKAAATPASHAIDPAARSNMLSRSGGLIVQPQDDGPSLLFLNTQTRVPEAAIGSVPAELQKILRLPITVSSRPSSVPVADAVKALADPKVAAVIVLGDDAANPSLLIAPENRWALVNVAALCGPDVSADKLAERVQKETWRAFAYLMGAANSTYEHCLMKSVLSPADLDALTAKAVCPEPLNQIALHAKKLGMKPVRLTTYRKAVEEGWAPAPSNEMQRSVWQELKK